MWLQYTDLAKKANAIQELLQFGDLLDYTGYISNPKAEFEEIDLLFSIK